MSHVNERFGRIGTFKFCDQFNKIVSLDASDRLAEAKKLGFGRAVLPVANMTQLTEDERALVALSPAVDLDTALREIFG